MNKIFTVLSAVLISANLWAQAPQSFSYQAVVRGSNNALVVNKPIGMKISLLQGSENGNAVYVETHKPTSNDNGLVSIAIGGGTKDASSTVFASIDWSKGPYFVKTETDPAGGTSYSLTTTSQLLSVPYAIHAKIAESIVGGSVLPSGGENGQGIMMCDGVPTWTTGGTCPGKPGPNITDAENNTYKTVTIGTQQWMAENLKVTKYNDGTAIPNITDNTQWSNLTTGSWSYYNNDLANNAKYGKLYNWHAVSKTTNGNKNVCPTGWHVPTEAEWSVLIGYLGGSSVAGGKMKEVVTASWNSPNTDATNTSLFSALPGGYRLDGGGYSNIGYSGYWWSSTESSTTNYARGRLLKYDNGDAGSYSNVKACGASVRCLRD